MGVWWGWIAFILCVNWIFELFGDFRENQSRPSQEDWTRRLWDSHTFTHFPQECVSAHTAFHSCSPFQFEFSCGVKNFCGTYYYLLGFVLFDCYFFHLKFWNGLDSDWSPSFQVIRNKSAAATGSSVITAVHVDGAYAAWVIITVCWGWGGVVHLTAAADFTDSTKGLNWWLLLFW